MKRIFCAILVSAAIATAVMTGCGSNNDKKDAVSATQWTVTQSGVSQAAPSADEKQSSGTGRSSENSR